MSESILFSDTSFFGDETGEELATLAARTGGTPSIFCGGRDLKDRAAGPIPYVGGMGVQGAYRRFLPVIGGVAGDDFAHALLGNTLL